jgi:hypothetical protein
VGVEKDYRDVGGGKALFGCCGRKGGEAADFYHNEEREYRMNTVPSVFRCIGSV